MSEPAAPPPAEVSEFYDEMWERYGHLDAASPAAFHRRRLIIELCLRYAPHAAQVLDAGCGRGELVPQLREAFPRATLCATDISLTSVRETQRSNPDLEVRQMDLCHPDFARQHADFIGRFPLITCSEVIEHIPDDRLALARVSQLLAPGGTLLLTVPGGKMSRFDELIGHQRHYSVRALRELAHTAGLEVLEAWAWGFPFQNLYRTAVRIASRFSMPSASTPAIGNASRSIGGALGAGYALFGRALKPLFYLNRKQGGEQMLLVARKR